jgi:hypothetical protein
VGRRRGRTPPASARGVSGDREQAGPARSSARCTARTSSVSQAPGPKLRRLAQILRPVPNPCPARQSGHGGLQPREEIVKGAHGLGATALGRLDSRRTNCYNLIFGDRISASRGQESRLATNWTGLQADRLGPSRPTSPSPCPHLENPSTSQALQSRSPDWLSRMPFGGRSASSRTSPRSR